MMNIRFYTIAWAVLIAAILPSTSRAQLVIQDNFTGTSSSYQWQSFNGACLTAGDGSGTIPKCSGLAYYGSESLVGGNTGTLPDSSGNGALRFTNGRPGGYNQNGAVVSNFTFPSNQGVQVTFTTVTYRGDSGGSGGDGADGMSFFLMDGSQSPGIGAFGGSLGYTCSNSNSPYDGLVGGYVGLGIDEYGNFLNPGDNTASGPGYQWNRIGLRGAGSISFSALHTLNPTYYPNSLLSATDSTYGTKARKAVRDTCRTGYLWNYSNASSPSQTSTDVLDYPAIPNAFKVLPSTGTGALQIANESAVKRGDGIPITYKLKITSDGLLSFAYSYNSGAYQPVITGQSITASNGALPANFRFGFAGSTGGSTNIHEIMCFQATPADQAASSAGLNQQQTAKVQTGTQVYFAFYNPSTWAGSLTSNYLTYSPTTGTAISNTANWDASCVLTGGTCAATGATGMVAEEWSAARHILSWNGTQGIPFKWASLTSTGSANQQATLGAADVSPSNGSKRLDFLRGDRSNEINPAGVGIYRTRTSVLGDIVDSSPTWVGPPSAPYTTAWVDRLNLSTTFPENTGQTYNQFIANQQTRLNVVYTGANDGFLHGFRTGSYDSSGNYVTTGSTPNDGYEVLAYMPGAVVNTIHNSTDPTLDFSSSQYGHNFFVDASPGTGDLYYGGAWHTWLVGGLGAGGAAIYALDITNPSAGNFVESNASSLVIGEWTSASLTCANVSNCGNNLGNTYGVPQIRRLHGDSLHGGKWGIIFGNGLGSSTGDAGIYVMTVDQSGARAFYYLSAGKSGTSDGIAYVTPADLDSDHITDYVYAGDVLGNVWRFDLSSADPAQWGLSNATPLFKTANGQPITTQLALVSASTSTQTLPRVLVTFGTGQQTPLTNTTPTTYATAGQALYGIWDWDMSNWNAKNSAQYASLSSATRPTATNTLQAQSILGTYPATGTATGYRTVSSYTVCWKGSAACAGGAGNNAQFGWTLALPSTSAEQVIYSPTLQVGAFIVNTTIPPTNTPTTCAASSASGWTMAISPSNGGAFQQSFFADSNRNFIVYNGQIVSGIALSGTGSVSIVTDASGTNLVTQTVAGTGAVVPVNPPAGTKGNRVTWIQKR